MLLLDIRLRLQCKFFSNTFRDEGKYQLWNINMKVNFILLMCNYVK